MRDLTFRGLARGDGSLLDRMKAIRRPHTLSAGSVTDLVRDPRYRLVPFGQANEWRGYYVLIPNVSYRQIPALSDRGLGWTGEEHGVEYANVMFFDDRSRIGAKWPLNPGLIGSGYLLHTSMKRVPREGTASIVTLLRFPRSNSNVIVDLDIHERGREHRSLYNEHASLVPDAH